MDPIARNLVNIQDAVKTLGRDVERLRSDVHLAQLSAPLGSGQPSPPTPPAEAQARPPNSELQARLRRYQYILDRTRSLPKNQFLDLVAEEMQHIWQETDPRAVKHPKLPRYMKTDRMRMRAALVVKEDWVKQGMWRPSFEGLIHKRYLNVGVWRHEKPLPLVDEDGVDLKTWPNTYAKLCRHRDNSRPCHQFLYQVEHARDRLLRQWRQSVIDSQGTENGEYPAVTTPSSRLPPPQIDTQAYQEVRKAWTKRRIWDTQWEVLPGQSWRHERPLEDFLTPQETKWLAEIKTTCVEPGFNGPHRLVHRVESEKELLEIFERRRGGVFQFRDGVVDPRRGLKRGREGFLSELISAHLSGSSDSGDDDSSDGSISDDEDVGQPLEKKKRVIEVPVATAEVSSDGGATGSMEQSSPERRRRAYKSPFVVDDDEST
ncbi:hypothetical protein PG993_012886 [Apiospora rasikravindrae]|uniref:Uncharacterized protein n=1 Tax=Apiospora rasikravindrae TaxID=990691 RepID=A0ABR1RW32_9PEZI